MRTIGAEYRAIKGKSESFVEAGGDIVDDIEPSVQGGFGNQSPASCRSIAQREFASQFDKERAQPVELLAGANGWAPGRVDSAPTSIQSAPSAAIASA